MIPFFSQNQRFQRLLDHFYQRFFYNDLVSSHDDAQLAAVNVMSMLGFPGILTLYWIPKYRVLLSNSTSGVLETSAFADRCLWLGFQMAILGLVASVQWDRLFPDRRDYRNLVSRPVQISVLFLAQSLALVRFIGLFFLIINLAVAFIYPAAVLPQGSGLADIAWFLTGHWISLTMSTAFVVGSVVSLRGILNVAVPTRILGLVSAVVQCALIAVFASFAVCGPILRSFIISSSQSLHGTVIDPGTAWFLPPVWFSGLAEWFSNRDSQEFALLAYWAIVAILVVTAVFLASYSLSYRRYITRSQEDHLTSTGYRAITNVLQATVDRWIRHGPEGAVFWFIVRTLLRNKAHLLYVGGFLSVGLGLATAQMWTALKFGNPAVVGHAQPYVLLFLVLAGIRMSFSIPAELPSNWTFRFQPWSSTDRYVPGIRKAVWAICPLPLGILTTIGGTAMVGPKYIFYHIPVWLIASWLSVEAVLWKQSIIPFACRHLPSRVNVIVFWTVLFSGMLLYGSAFSILERWILGHPPLIALAALVIPPIFRYWRSPPTQLRFEKSDPAVETLGLQ